MGICKALSILGFVGLLTPWCLAGNLDQIVDAYLVAKAEAGPDHLDVSKVNSKPYTVQVAAYLSETDAIDHVKDLKPSEKEVFYFSSFSRGQVWYKVGVRRFGNYDDAEKYRKKFVKKFEEPFSVVVSLKGSVPPRHVASAPKPEVEIKKESPQVPVATETPSVEDAPKAEAATVVLKKAPSVEVTSTETAVVDKPKTPKFLSGDYLYALQVGAFTGPDEAATKLASLGDLYKGRIEKAEVNGKTWHRVLVGTFETKKEAEVFRASFMQSHPGESPFVKRFDK